MLNVVTMLHDEVQSQAAIIFPAAAMTVAVLTTPPTTLMDVM